MNFTGPNYKSAVRLLLLDRILKPYYPPGHVLNSEQACAWYFLLYPCTSPRSRHCTRPTTRWKTNSDVVPTHQDERDHVP